MSNQKQLLINDQEKVNEEGLDSDLHKLGRAFD